MAVFLTAFWVATFLAAFLAGTFLVATFLVAFFAAFLVALFFTLGASAVNSGCCGLATGAFFGLVLADSFFYLGFGASMVTSRGWNEPCFGWSESGLLGSRAGTLGCS